MVTDAVVVVVVVEVEVTDVVVDITPGVVTVVLVKDWITVVGDVVSTDTVRVDDTGVVVVVVVVVVGTSIVLVVVVVVVVDVRDTIVLTVVVVARVPAAAARFRNRLAAYSAGSINGDLFATLCVVV